MASFSNSLAVVLKHEGGYNRATSGSGETYRGIDRRYHPNWSGWAIIDKYKSKNGIPKEESYINVTGLNEAVVKWYSDFYKPMVNLAAINNQTTADFTADFLIHKQYDAIRVINAAAKTLANVPTDIYKITPQVLQVMNNKAENFYKTFYSFRIAYYNNPATFGSKLKFSLPYVKAFTDRVNKFPAVLQYNIFSWLENIFK